MSDGFSEIRAGGVSGFLHQPATPNGDAVALTHGAGGNCRMPLLLAVAEGLAGAGFLVLRYDLAFRQKRPSGPPAGNGAADRESIGAAADLVRTMVGGRLVLSGQSYGGRQSSMLASERPEAADGLILFSYPLHPPGKPAQLRNAHFPALRMPSLFVQGTKDPFGSPEEIRGAILAVAARSRLSLVEGAGHDLKRGKFDMQRVVLDWLVEWRDANTSTRVVT